MDQNAAFGGSKYYSHEPKRVCRPVVVDWRHFEEKPGPEPHLSEKSDPEPIKIKIRIQIRIKSEKSDLDPHRSVADPKKCAQTHFEDVQPDKNTMEISVQNFLFHHRSMILTGTLIE